MTEDDFRKFIEKDPFLAMMLIMLFYDIQGKEGEDDVELVKYCDFDADGGDSVDDHHSG